eukprot:c16099_g1_i1 orf=218-889(-)
MDQQPYMLYSFVARGTVILTDYKELEGNYVELAKHSLRNLPSENNTLSYISGQHALHFLIEDGFAYLVVAHKTLGRRLAFTYLEIIKDEFKQNIGGKANIAMPHSLDKEFRPILKQHMEYCLSHPEEMENLMKVKSKVLEVKGIMMENIEKVLDRGENIEVLLDKSNSLRSQAQNFRVMGTGVKWKTWLQSTKLKLAVIALLVILAFVLFLFICHGFKCSRFS